MSKLYFQGLQIDSNYPNYQTINNNHPYKKYQNGISTLKYINNNRNSAPIQTKTQTAFTPRTSQPITQTANRTNYKLNNIDLNYITQSKNPIAMTESNYIEINDIMGVESRKPLSLDLLNFPAENYEPSKYSSKTMGTIKAYGANTYQGIVRNYNEDRVSIIINMNKPPTYKKAVWPKISFFGIYDGHGGSGCAEFLRDNLHKFICNDPSFPTNVVDAIKHGFSLAEKEFLNNYALNPNNTSVIKDRSGSCAVVLIIVENKCYVANVGDSRAILSVDNGKTAKDITVDHKPNNPLEKSRIVENGGSVYQSQTPIPSLMNQILIGPYRVMPGRLSVSRTIGDVEAKKITFGGLPNVIIPTPEIFVIDINKADIDFFILGCDGIFDQMTSKDVIDCAWMVFNQNKEKDLHSKCGKAIDLILKSAMFRKSFDNVTSLIVMIKDLYDTGKQSQPLVNSIFTDKKANKKLNIETDLIKSNNLTLKPSSKSPYQNYFKTTVDENKNNFNLTLKRYDTNNNNKSNIKNLALNTKDTIGVNYITSNNFATFNNNASIPSNRSLSKSAKYQRPLNTETNFKNAFKETPMMHKMFAEKYTRNPTQANRTSNISSNKNSKIINKNSFMGLSHNKYINHTNANLTASGNYSIGYKRK